MLWLPEPFLYVSILFTYLMPAMAVGSLYPRGTDAGKGVERYT
jgi:hypothetical protein